MASYLPSTLITQKAMGNGSANIATWQVQNTLGASTFHVHRTLVAETPTAAPAITIEMGGTSATTTAQRMLDAYVLTVNVPFVQNWWVAVPNNSYFGGFANNTTTNAGSYGYTFS